MHWHDVVWEYTSLEGDEFGGELTQQSNLIAILESAMTVPVPREEFIVFSSQGMRSLSSIMTLTDESSRLPLSHEAGQYSECKCQTNNSRNPYQSRVRTHAFKDKGQCTVVLLMSLYITLYR